MFASRPRSRYDRDMKDEELPDDWPGEPVSVRALVEADGKLSASIDGKRAEPEDVPDLVAALARGRSPARRRPLPIPLLVGIAAVITVAVVVVGPALYIFGACVFFGICV